MTYILKYPSTTFGKHSSRARPPDTRQDPFHKSTHTSRHYNIPASLSLPMTTVEKPLQFLTPRNPFSPQAYIHWQRQEQSLNAIQKLHLTWPQISRTLYTVRGIDEPIHIADGSILQIRHEEPQFVCNGTRVVSKIDYQNWKALGLAYRRWYGAYYDKDNHLVIASLKHSTVQAAFHVF